MLREQVEIRGGSEVGIENHLVSFSQASFSVVTKPGTPVLAAQLISQVGIVPIAEKTE